jgi:hypothetical protein
MILGISIHIKILWWFDRDHLFKSKHKNYNLITEGVVICGVLITIMFKLIYT